MNNEYPDYAADELLQHPGFLAAMQTVHPQQTPFWQEWVLRYPHREQELEMAAQLYRLMHMHEEMVPTEADYEEVWGHIQAQTAVRRPRPRRIRYVMQLAAAVLLVLGIGGVLTWWLAKPSMVTMQTQRQVRRLLLPDGTQVVMQPGSECRYYRRMAGAAQREVWIKGAVYLDVTKGTKPFVVHLDSMEVTVLGTRFNVISRERQQHVMLDQGSVKVTTAGSELLLRPGEIAMRRGAQLNKQLIDATLYTGWRTGKLVFNNTTMKDIIGLLEYAYGYEVRCPDDQGLLSRQISGSIAADNETSLLYTLSVAFNISFIQRDNIITIIPNHSNS